MLTFDSRMRNSTSDQVLRVEISGDGGLGWKTVFRQTGTNNNYVNRQISLAPWAGKRIRIRFRYGIAEELLSYSYYSGTSASVGFLVDNISLTGVSRLVDCDSVDLANTTSFSFGTSVQGTYFLSARARVWGGYPGFDDAVAHRLDVIDTTDTDDDGVIDFFDNCPLIDNFDQADFDGDGDGDVCDIDDDNDGVDDVQDDFPFNAAASVDNDLDGMPDTFHETCGNACQSTSGLVEDGDDDNDNVDDGLDNCPFDANPDQANNDSDPLGNACDPDSDNDGVEDGLDINPLNPRICGDSDVDNCDDCAVGRDRAGV